MNTGGVDISFFPQKVHNSPPNSDSSKNTPPPSPTDSTDASKTVGGTLQNSSSDNIQKQQVLSRASSTEDHNRQIADEQYKQAMNLLKETERVKGELPLELLRMESRDRNEVLKQKDADAIPKYQSVIELLKSADNLGNPDAPYQVGHMYEHGTGVPVDLKLASQYYETAAGRGSTAAMYMLGTWYKEGKPEADVAKDFQKCVQLFKKAADLSDSISKFELDYIVRDCQKILNSTPLDASNLINIGYLSQVGIKVEKQS